MRTLHVDLSVPEGCTPEDAAKLRRVWTTHADKCRRDRNDWRIVFDAADAVDSADATADAVVSIHVTSWVHWNALFASNDVSLSAALIHSALYVRQPHVSLPELAGEALPFFDNPAALFEQ